MPKIFRDKLPVLKSAKTNVVNNNDWLKYIRLSKKEFKKMPENQQDDIKLNFLNKIKELLLKHSGNINQDNICEIELQSLIKFIREIDQFKK